MYYFGFAGLDHGWFRLEMYKNGGPIPKESSLVYYIGSAGLDHGWSGLEMYEKRELAHP